MADEALTNACTRNQYLAPSHSDLRDNKQAGTGSKVNEHASHASHANHRLASNADHWCLFNRPRVFGGGGVSIAYALANACIRI